MDSGIFLRYHCRVLCSLKTRAIQIKPHSITHWTVWSDLGWGFWTPWFYPSLLLHACFCMAPLQQSLYLNCIPNSTLLCTLLTLSCLSPAIMFFWKSVPQEICFPLHARIVRSPFLEVSLTDMVSSHCYSHTMDLLKSYGYCAMWS